MTSQSSRTILSFQDEKIYINHQPTYAGTLVEGLLFNIRTVNATFDDTINDKGFWDDDGTHPENGYAGYGVWSSPASAQANTQRFIAALPEYKDCGILAVNLNFQGGHPLACHHDNEWSKKSANTGANGQRDVLANSGFLADGSIDPLYRQRITSVIEACDQLQMAVILQLFYFGQDTVFPNEESIKAAVDNAVDYICENKWRHVLLEIANEVSQGHFHHGILKSNRVVELIDRARDRARRKHGYDLLVSTSEASITNPRQWSSEDIDQVFSHSDYVLLHGGDGRGTGAIDDFSSLNWKIGHIRSRPWFQAKPRPIIFNEVDTAGGAFDVIIGKRASFGLHSGKYLQDVWPTRWGVWNNEILWYFKRVSGLTGSPGNPLFNK